MHPCHDADAIRVIVGCLAQAVNFIRRFDDGFENDAYRNFCRRVQCAGDAFRTGFLFGILTGETVEGSARIANAVAALKCRGLGARSALPDRKELIGMVGI